MFTRHGGAPSLDGAPVRSTAARRWVAPVVVACVLFAVYNANGREITTADSQPTRFTVLAILSQGTLRLDAVTAPIRAVVEQRPAFQRDRRGHFRSAYPVAPALLAAGLALPWVKAGLIDLDAILAASLVAKLAASAIVAAAVALAFVIARRRVSSFQAALIAAGLGLGTNYWALASQTLWQHETVALGLLGGLALLAVPAARLSAPRLAWGIAMLGLAAAARPQVVVTVIILSAWAVTRRRRWRDAWTLLPLFLMGAGVIYCNIAWFGHPLGATPRLEALHETVHGVSGSFGHQPWMAAAGLLASPSRGLLVFSPIVLVAVAGLGAARRADWDSELRWCALGAAAQFAVYASYSVWWAGHTYGPRYLLDVLPLLVPLAAAAMPAVACRRWARAAAIAALAWSVTLAATGAFVYPAELWNSEPSEIDKDHARLWDWKDPQFARCWTTSADPRNFQLFTVDSVRRRAGTRP